jgi:TonB family protein
MGNSRPPGTSLNRLTARYLAPRRAGPTVADKQGGRSSPCTEGFAQMFRRIWPWLVILAVPATSSASMQVPSPRLRQAVLTEREHQVWKTPTRAAEFSDVPHASARPRCEDTQPPEALTTPDPLLVPAGAGLKVKVSFIIGADGRVHSPLILQSAGTAGDRNVLRTVRTWRYRPATCNGVPTEAEGKIEFSRR